MLPGSFYVRAFIKTYAETVGLNPDELLEGHKKDVPEEETEATMEPVIQKRSSRPVYTNISRLCAKSLLHRSKCGKGKRHYWTGN